MIVAGFGCRAGATMASLSSALEATDFAPDALAAPSHRSRIVASLADALGVPAIEVEPAILSAIATPTRSDASFRAFGTGSVSEATALAAAGPGARLVVRRRVSADRMATCAIAKAAE